MEDRPRADPRWYDGFFDHEWLALLAPDADAAERTEREVSFLVEHLELEPGARILDLACGHGRHSLALARVGFRVTGLDLSEPSLERARETTGRERLDVDFVLADMREIPFTDEFDAVVNLFSSFGYLENEDEDARVLAAVRDALKPGGAFVLEGVNAPCFFRRYREGHWDELADGTVLLEERLYDIPSGRNEVTWTLVGPTGRRTELRHSLRLYTPAEMFAMLRAAGLEPAEAWGGYDGAELSLDSWRWIVLARRTA